MVVKGKLKLIDFGISEVIQDDVTSMTIVQPEGTPNYIAPEVSSYRGVLFQSCIIMILWEG